jgi:hypothetical protein
MILKFPMRKDRSSLLICAHAFTWKTWWKSKGCRISRFFWGRRSEIRQARITALIRFERLKIEAETDRGAFHGRDLATKRY